MANRNLLSFLGTSLFLFGCSALVACASSSSGSSDPAGGGGSGAGGSGAALEPKLSAIRATTFKISCANSGSCHTGPNPGGFLDLADTRTSAAIIGDLKKASTADMVTPNAVPGMPDASLMVHKLTGDFTGLPCAKGDLCGTKMPQTGPALPAPQIQQIKDWIAGGMMDN